MNTTPRRLAEVVIHVTGDAPKGVGAWSLLGEVAGETSTYRFSGTSHQGVRAAIRLAMETLITQFGAGPVVLYSQHEHVRELAAPLADDGWDLKVYSYDEHYPHPLHVEAAQLSVDALRQHAPPPQPQTRLIASVDGSYSHYSKAAGWGVIRSDGKFFVGSSERSSGALYAELRAIELAVSRTPRGQHLLVRSDSRGAIHAVTQSERLSRLDKHTARTVRRIRDKMSRRHVEFEWVRGHAGDILNEGADRLAVSARRNRESHTDMAVAVQMSRQIVQDALEALREPAGIPVPA